MPADSNQAQTNSTFNPNNNSDIIIKESSNNYLIPLLLVVICTLIFFLIYLIFNKPEISVPAESDPITEESVWIDEQIEFDYSKYAGASNDLGIFEIKMKVPADTRIESINNNLGQFNYSIKNNDYELQLGAIWEAYPIQYPNGVEKIGENLNNGMEMYRFDYGVANIAINTVGDSEFLAFYTDLVEEGDCIKPDEVSAYGTVLAPCGAFVIVSENQELPGGGFIAGCKNGIEICDQIMLSTIMTKIK